MKTDNTTQRPTEQTGGHPTVPRRPQTGGHPTVPRRPQTGGYPVVAPSLATLCLLAAALLSLATLAGCSDDAEQDTCADNPSAATCADAGLDVTDTGEEPVVASCLVISAQGSESGAIAVLDLDTLEVEADLTSTHRDARILVNDGDVYVINRLGADNVQKLTPGSWSTAWQRSVGTGANPYDIAFDGDRAWVVLFGDGAVAELDLAATSAAAFLTGERVDVPLGPLDGTRSEPVAIARHEGTLLVLTQQIGDDYQCADGAQGIIYAFDADTLEPAAFFGEATSLALDTCNPGGWIVEDDALIVQSVGGYRISGNTDDDGAVERVDLTTGEATVLFRESDVEDGLDTYALYPGAAGYWLVAAGDDFQALTLHRVTVNGSTVTVSDRIYSGAIWGLHEHDGRLFLSERRADGAGIVVLDAATGEAITDEPIDTGFPPRGVAAVEVSGGCF